MIKIKEPDGRLSLRRCRVCDEEAYYGFSYGINHYTYWYCDEHKPKFFNFQYGVDYVRKQI